MLKNPFFISSKNCDISTGVMNIVRLKAITFVVVRDVVRVVLTLLSWLVSWVNKLGNRESWFSVQGTPPKKNKPKNFTLCVKLGCGGQQNLLCKSQIRCFFQAKIRQKVMKVWPDIPLVAKISVKLGRGLFKLWSI